MSLFDVVKSGIVSSNVGGLGSQYPLQQYNTAGMAYTPNLKQRLEAAVVQAEEQLQAVREAKEIFDRNPDIERLLDIMQRGHF